MELSYAYSWGVVLVLALSFHKEYIILRIVCLFVVVCLIPYPDVSSPKGHARGPKASYLPLEIDTAKKRPCAAFHRSPFLWGRVAPLFPSALSHLPAPTRLSLFRAWRPCILRINDAEVWRMSRTIIYAM